MQSLDLFLLSLIARFAGRSWKLDYAVFCVSNSDLLKGGLFMTVIWGFWFLGEPSRERRTTILALLAGAMLALGVGKAVEKLGPYSPRPYQADLPGLTFPFDMGMSHHESSFPSDHSILFFALATGLCFLSRRVGAAAFLYAAIIIGLPRLYLGLHYPSDLFGGAALGILSVLVLRPARELIARPLLRFREHSPGWFHAGFFLVTFQVSTLFDSTRALARMAAVLVGQ